MIGLKVGNVGLHLGGDQRGQRADNLGRRRPDDLLRREVGRELEACGEGKVFRGRRHLNQQRLAGGIAAVRNGELAAAAR